MSTLTTFEKLTKEFSTDKDGKGFVTRRGLGRLCGVKYQSWGQGDSLFTVEIDQYLADGGFDVTVVKPGCGIPDIIYQKN